MRLLGVAGAVGVTFLLWFSYAMVAVEGDDSRSVLQLGWLFGLVGSSVTLLMLAKPPGSKLRTAAAYSLVGIAFSASWAMQQNEGLAWGRLEVTMATLAVVALALSVFLAVPPVVREWSARGPYATGPRD